MDIFALSQKLVDDLCEESPTLATGIGVAGFDHLWTDFGPEANDRRADLVRYYQRQLQDLPTEGDQWAQLARRVMREFLEDSLIAHEHDDHLRSLNNVASPLQEITSTFDLMDGSSAAGCDSMITRLETLPEALESYWDSLALGLDRSLPVAQRQVEAAIEESRSYAGSGPFLNELRDRLTACNGDRADRAVSQAGAGYARFADRLEVDYLPHATQEDGVGRERYTRDAARFLGTHIDPEETYAWGWHEVQRLWDRMVRVADEILPGATVGEALAILKEDPDRSVATIEEFLEIIAARQEDAVQRLAGSHFDIPDQIRNVAVKLGPPGAALGASYMAPSEDFSRPGTIYYSPGDRDRHPLYDEISTSYHEGFPGHHLQVGIQVGLADRLSRLHRLIYWLPGYGEGWALYTEQLMDELGFYEKPDYVMGLLINQMHRACRIVIDIGCHLDLPIPSNGMLDEQRWGYQAAVTLLQQKAFLHEPYAESEVVRYLGWPGQAISYKVGERVIMELREDERRRLGSSFDLKAFHNRVLGSGPVGLDHLRELV